MAEFKAEITVDDVFDVLEALYRVNNPDARFHKRAEVKKLIVRHKLQNDIQAVANNLDIRPGKELQEYLDLIRLNSGLAGFLFLLFHELGIVADAGEPRQGNFYVEVRFSLGLSSDIAIFLPAVVPVSNPQYTLIPAEEMPGFEGDFPIGTWSLLNQSKGMAVRYEPVVADKSRQRLTRD